VDVGDVAVTLVVLPVADAAQSSSLAAEVAAATAAVPAGSLQARKLLVAARPTRSGAMSFHCIRSAVLALPRTLQTPSCSLPQTMPASSPAPNWSSMAASTR
jgi:hypothetical protein